MKTTRKFLALVVFTVLIVGALAVTAFATGSNDITVTWKNGDEVLATSTVKDGEIPKVPAEIGDFDKTTRNVILGWTSSKGGEVPETFAPLKGVKSKTYYAVLGGVGNISVQEGAMTNVYDVKPEGFKEFVEGVKTSGAIIKLYEDFEANPSGNIGLQTKLTFDLNGHTFSQSKKFEFWADSANFTVKNGVFNTGKGSNELCFSQKRGKFTIQDCTVNLTQSLVNFRKGYFYLNNSTVNASCDYIIRLSEQWGEASAYVNNSTINCQNEGTAVFAVNRSDANKAFTTTVKVTDSVINGGTLMHTRYYIHADSKFNVSIIGKTVLNNLRWLTTFKTNATDANINLTFSDNDAILSSVPKISIGKITIPQDSVIISANENYRILPKLTDGQVYVNIDSDVNLVYVLPFAEGQKPVATFTLATENGNIVQKVNGVPVGGNKFAFKFENIDPRYFGDIISIVVEPAPSATISASTITVKDYLLKAVELNPADNALKALASDILRYGAAAQTYKNYKVDALVTKDVDLANGSDVTLDKSLLNFKGTNAETKISSIAFRLEGEVNMLVKIKAKDIEGLNLVVTVNGRKVTIPVTAENKQTDGSYVVAFPVNAYEFDDAISLTLKNANSELGTVTYSVNSYIFERLSTVEEPEKSLLQAMANYGASAKAYATKA